MVPDLAVSDRLQYDLEDALDKHARLDRGDRKPLHPICEYKNGSLGLVLDSLPEEFR
jgi:hypothetical protein